MLSSWHIRCIVGIFAVAVGVFGFAVGVFSEIVGELVGGLVGGLVGVWSVLGWWVVGALTDGLPVTRLIHSCMLVVDSLGVQLIRRLIHWVCS